MNAAQPYEGFLTVIERNLSQVGPGPEIEHMFNVEAGIQRVLGCCEPDRALQAAADQLWAETRKAAGGCEHDGRRALEAFKQALVQSRLR